MVAIATPCPTPVLRPTTPVARRSEPVIAAPAGRPPLAVVALLALLALVAVGYLALSSPVGEPGSLPAGPSESVVAELGDSMWSLAVEHAPAGQAAGYVEAMVVANGNRRTNVTDDQ